ncbi:MAG: hypothetical protein RIE52_06580 [Balneola sp.]|jgi:hypothetical protein
MSDTSFKKNSKRKEERYDTISAKIRTGLFCSVLLMNLLIFNESVLAQPGLPGDPAQAPIDGGLGLLAAVGGAYAYKKLKRKNENESIG